MNNSVFNFLTKNGLKIGLIILLIVLLFYVCNNKINLTISSSIVGLIGVVLGWSLSVGSFYLKEKYKKKKILRAFLNELIINSNIIKKDYLRYDELSEGLRNTIFNQAYTAGIFVGLPHDLQGKIYNLYRKVDLIKRNPSRFYDQVNLEQEVDSAIDKLREFLNKKNLSNQ